MRKKIMILEFISFKLIAFFITTSLITISINIVNPYVTYIFSQFINNLSSPISTCITAIILYILLQLVMDIGEVITSHLNIQLDYIIKDSVIDKINKKLSQVKLEELENPDIYNLIDRSLNELPSIINAFITNTTEFIAPFTSLITYTLILYKTDKLFPLIILLCSIPSFLSSLLKGREFFLQKVSQNTKTRQLDYLEHILTNRNYIKEIKLFKLTDYFLRKYIDISKCLYKENVKLTIKQNTRNFFINFINNLLLGFCFIIICNKIYNNVLQIGDFYLVVSAITIVSSNINGIITSITSLSSSTYYFKEWKQFNNLADEYVNDKDIDNWTIKFINVSFKYPNSNKLVLKNINLKINPQEKIAIVGTNGSGKSTLINLLLGNFSPSSGQILIDNMPITNCIKKFRAGTSCLFQNYIQFPLSLYDNLYVTYENNKTKIEEINTFDLNSLVLSLPCQYDTLLGQLEENAIELSGGQWQKVALNRAILKPNTHILILDEPTSSFDPITEDNFYSSFNELSINKTSIVITHRLGITQLCDKIIVLDDGKIIETGSHISLMELKGAYYNMFTSQRSLYSD